MIYWTVPKQFSGILSGEARIFWWVIFIYYRLCVYLSICLLYRYIYVCVYICFIWLIIKFITILAGVWKLKFIAFNHLGHLWCLHSSGTANSNKQETQRCKDIQPSSCCCWSTLVTSISSHTSENHYHVYFNQVALFATKNRYGIEQEYTLLQKDVKWPVGWPLGGFPGPQVMELSNNNTPFVRFSHVSID